MCRERMHVSRETLGLKFLCAPPVNGRANPNVDCDAVLRFLVALDFDGYAGMAHDVCGVFDGIIKEAKIPY